jgi:hypothetical protein
MGHGFAQAAGAANNHSRPARQIDLHVNKSFW